MAGKIISVVNPSPQDLAEWIRWILEQPAGSNPAEDAQDAGERAAQDNGKGDVWFLAGGLGNPNGQPGTVTRHAAVPAGQEILIVAASSDASPAEHEKWGLDPADKALALKLKDIATTVAHEHTNILLKIIPDAAPEQAKTFQINDPKQKSELQLIESGVTPVRFPVNNVYKERYGVKGGLTPLDCVAWGAKVILEPGKYTVLLQAEHPEKGNITAGGITFKIPKFKLDVEYKLTAVSAITKLNLL